MGGIVFIVATVIAYVAGHFVLATLPSQQLGAPTGITTTGVVLLGLFVGLGLVGFLDDFLKVRKRNSLGLSMKQKLAAQTLVGAVCGWIALWFPSAGKEHETVADSTISFVKDLHWLDITRYGALVLFIFVVLSMSNAVNLTDGLDGLATGSSVMVLGSYAFIAFWQYRHWDVDDRLQRPLLVRGARPSGDRDHRGRGRRGVLRLPVVEHVTGPDLHGRHRFAGAGRADRGPGVRHPHRAAAAAAGRAVHDHRDHLGDPDRVVPALAAPGVPDGAAAAPLRAGRWSEVNIVVRVLDHRRARGLLLAVPVLRRLPAGDGIPVTSYEGRRVLVAGSGVAGAACVEVLLALGDRVTLLDRLSSDTTDRLAHRRGRAGAGRRAAGRRAERVDDVIVSPGYAPAHPGRAGRAGGREAGVLGARAGLAAARTRRPRPGSR
jgi:hypothetical protein